MKVTYIKTKNTENLNVPELVESVGEILSKYLNQEGELDDDCFVCINGTEGETEENFMFMDEETTNNLIEFYREYNFLIEHKDITLDVKNGSCEMNDFKKCFNDKDSSDINVKVLHTFLQKNMTTNDVLDKISAYGLDRLTESDKKLL